jgi:hypothetical protein
MGNSATSAQRAAIITAWVPAVNAFMAAHPELRTDASEADKNNSALCIEHDIEKLEKQIAEKREELRKVHISGRQASGVVQFPCCKAYGVVNKNHVCPERMTFDNEVIS